MRKLMFAALPALLLATPASADERNFTLANHSNRAVVQLFISPANVNEWEEDVLSVDTLADGASVEVQFVDDLDECVYDLKIVHDDGDSAIWGGINLCEANEVGIQYQDDGTPIAQVS